MSRLADRSKPKKLAYNYREQGQRHGFKSGGTKRDSQAKFFLYLTHFEKWEVQFSVYSAIENSTVNITQKAQLSPRDRAMRRVS